MIRNELWQYVTFHNLQLLLNDIWRASQNKKIKNSSNIINVSRILMALINGIVEGNIHHNHREL